MEFEDVRKRSGLCKEELRNYVFGGEERWRQVKTYINDIADTGFFRDPRICEMSRYDVIGKTIEKSVKELFPIPIKSHNDYPDEAYANDSILPIGGVGWLMVSKLIEVLGTEKQCQDWIHKIISHDWLASYAQTEIAHGTDVKSLQTIATFDKATQEFIIHSPTIEAIKWWPGEIGVYCTHSLIFARLISNGVDHGVQPFFCQVRSLEDHKQLPGIECGDIGPKLGYSSKDNGYMRLTNFRIPKTSLLGKYITVSKEGDVEILSAGNAMYSSMMFLRTGIAGSAYYNLLKSVVIALRYSIKRTQFKDTNGQEIPIIMYQMQKQKIYTNLCRGMTMNAAYIYLLNAVKDNDRRVNAGDFSLMKDTHIDLCGHKAWYTEWLNYGAIEMMRACGGHGYSVYGGIAQMFSDDFPTMILEGENSVLFLQIARNLLKVAQQAQSGNVPEGKMRYFTESPDEIQLPLAKDDLSNPEKLMNAFKHSCILNTMTIRIKMMDELSSGLDPKAIWDYKIGSRLWDIGKIHGIISIASNAWERIRNNTSGKLNEVMNKVFIYFLLDMIECHAKLLSRTNSFSNEAFEYLQESKEDLIEYLDDHALVLAESPNFHDNILMSAIGHSNGKPYENLYEWTNKYSVLNNLKDRVHPAIIEHFHPFRKQLKEKL